MESFYLIISKSLLFSFKKMIVLKTFPHWPIQSKGMSHWRFGDVLIWANVPSPVRGWRKIIWCCCVTHFINIARPGRDRETSDWFINLIRDTEIRLSCTLFEFGWHLRSFPRRNSQSLQEIFSNFPSCPVICVISTPARPCSSCDQGGWADESPCCFCTHGKGILL